MPHALILGAGIAGLASAIALRREGWSVEIADRAPALAPLGAALTLWPNAIAALRLLGAAERIEQEAAPVRRMLLATTGGTRLIDRPVADTRLPVRPLLQEALREVCADVPLRLDSEAVTLDPGGTTVSFADGKQTTADLVIVADGIHSRLGSAITGTEAHYCGYTGVVALSDTVMDDDHDGVGAEYWGRHERFGLFDLGGGKRYWFYMRTAAEDAEFDDLAGRATRFPAAIACALAATPDERRHRWPIHAKPPPRRLIRRRAICVGDAGHAMEPNLGQGACQAIEDALALGIAARTARLDDVPRVFEALRLRRVRTMVRRSAEGGRAVHGSVPTQVAMRFGLRLVPRAVSEFTIGGLQRLPDYRR